VKHLLKEPAKLSINFLSYGHRFDVNAKEFEEGRAGVVNHAWIERKMLKTEVRIKQSIPVNRYTQHL
jgi:hypothetical protein